MLHGKVELLEGKAPQADVRSLARQVERLERYVQAMSTVQKLEDRPVVRTTCERKALARVLGETGNALCASRGVRFALDDAGQGTVFVDGALVEEVAANLLTNAARHAQEQVTLRMETRQGDLVMAVEDDGPGFSAEALAKGCEPFFSETPSEDHFGLGLNICSVLCRRHGGSLRLENRIGEGGMKLAAAPSPALGRKTVFDDVLTAHRHLPRRIVVRDLDRQGALPCSTPNRSVRLKKARTTPSKHLEKQGCTKDMWWPLRPKAIEHARTVSRIHACGRNAQPSWRRWPCWRRPVWQRRCPSAPTSGPSLPTQGGCAPGWNKTSS